MRTSLRQRFKGFSLFYGAGLCVCGVLVGYLLFFGGSDRLFAPLYPLRAWVASPSFTPLSWVRTQSSLLAERDGLIQELSRRTRDLDRIIALEIENSMLRGMETREGRIVADVLRRPNDTPYDTVLVYQGSNAGVFEGSLVYDNESVIGFVSRVSAKSSLVTLFSTPGIESPFYLLGPNIFTSAYGEGNGILRVGIPHGVSVSEGDVGVVPIPGSGTYGTVQYVVSDDSRPEQYAYVSQESALRSLRFVTIDTVPLPILSRDEMLNAVASSTNTPLSQLLGVWSTTTEAVAP